MFGMASEIANGGTGVDVRPADTGNTKATILLVGGFGALRGSERIVALGWNGERLSRLAPEDEPSWRGRGVDCGGSRPRHILPIGNLLLVANEVSNDLTVYREAFIPYLP